MFRFSTEQKVCHLAGIKIGGQPGDNPPLLIANMFQTGDKIIRSRKGGDFDRERAVANIRELEAISAQTGVPAMVALVANNPTEARRNIDFFVEESDLPFAADMWRADYRVEAARYVGELGLQDRFLYNSITPWDGQYIPFDDQMAQLREAGIKHVVVQAFDVADPTAQGRVTSLRDMLRHVGEDSFESVLVDTATMNLPAMAITLEANWLIKEQFGLPVGCAPANASYAWKKAYEKREEKPFLDQVWGRKGFQGMDAGVHALSVLWSDFLLYGPMTGTQRIFTGVAAAAAILSTFAFAEGASLPEADNHPLNLLFPDVAEQLRESGQ